MMSLPRRKVAENLLNKLHQKQLTGKWENYNHGQGKAPLFGRLNERLIFQLDKVIPLSALESGHILLGFSKCAQFLLTYTHSVELEVNLLTMVHKYKLHWWSFVPYKQASKVAEVTLFSDQGVSLALQIVLCYWPGDSTHILVHGSSIQSEGESRECYLTVTSVPSVNCPDCYRIAQSFEDEDLAASWDSCVRFSCLRHGYTIHSNYSTVPPYPSFIASVSLRCDGTIVINTANFLHVLSFQVEFPSCGSGGEQDFLLSQSASLDEVNQHLPAIHPEWEEDSERSYSFSNVRSTSSVTSNTPNMSPNFNSSSSQRKSIESPIPHGNSSNQESEYDFMEDTSELPRETISAFRKRRLADKKYEFTDENTENIPLKVMRKRRDLEHQLQQQLQQHQPFVVVSGSKDVNEDWEWNFSCTVGTNDVLRPFNSNIPTPIRSPDWDRLGELVEDIRPPIEPQREPSKLAEPPTCVAQFQRRYFEVDDELVSVITDIEDDDLSSSTGYHNALPLEVHGAGYNQMAMVSNAKAFRLKLPHVCVKQMSIDTEQFCHEMAQRLCTQAQKKYWFCSDFNVEIIDLCLETNDVVAAAYMLVEADVPQTNQKMQRCLCQASVFFAWNTETGQHRIIDYDLPVEIATISTQNQSLSTSRSGWHPAKDIGRRLRKELMTPAKPVYTLTNIPELTGRSFNVIYDPSRTFAIVLYEKKY
uniref:DDB1- and CUL4-associated factor 15 WD40 repeat-containing domain-containing protein n=1 Tax=Daphnia galeata TaxID=27404 RepID=A0A8J2RET8_9CRUS|nr:unnamed protein product [Daphnia galeata]